MLSRACFLGETDRADLRLREHRRRDEAVVDLGGLVVEQRLGESVCIMDRDRA